MAPWGTIVKSVGTGFTKLFSCGKGSLAAASELSAAGAASTKEAALILSRGGTNAAVASDMMKGLATSQFKAARAATITGKATQTAGAAVGLTAAYKGWGYLTEKKEHGGIIQDVAGFAIGDDRVKKITSITGAATDKVANVLGVGDQNQAQGQNASQPNGGMAPSADGTNWPDMSSILGGGNPGANQGPLDCIKGFFSNMLNGKVGIMPIVGLIASAYLMFGRFGWLGRIGGLLLSMLLIGNNSRVAQYAPTQPALDNGYGEGQSQNTGLQLDGLGDEQSMNGMRR